MLKKNMIRVLEISCIAAFCVLISACAAYDLGNEGKKVFPPNNVDNPVWEDNIKNIVEFKCASCHTPKEPWYKPKNTPAFRNAENPNFSLENIALQAFFDEKNQDLMRKVKQCLESVCGLEAVPMPPKYATPLDPQEKQGLLNYVSKYIVRAPSTLSTFFQSKCATCHGDDGKSKSASTGNKSIGESQSDTFAKFQNAYKTLAPMPSYSTGYTDADALSDWNKITGKTLSSFFASKCSSCHGDNGTNKTASTGNKMIGESQSDTFAKYQNAYKTIAPMTGIATGYSDADARNDWQYITGKQ
ncbi:MAG: hypothetical protein RI932_554 [Pseudomonadota bacterium]|jgi:mono/diheme cytochrome c family protein